MKLFLDIEVLYCFWFCFGFLVDEVCKHVTEVPFVKAEIRVTDLVVL